jgi:hypothetical protein
MKKIPIVTCNIGSPTIEVMKASIKAYAPDHELIIHYCERTTFGQSYNEILEKVFKDHDEVIVANDDVVLTPTTMEIFLADIEKVKRVENKIGFIGCMHDSARPGQNVRYKVFDNDELNFGKWHSERVIKCVPVVAPIFAYMPKKAFETHQFPPITWYSDDVMCEDLNSAGFKHFISTAYVHHVGSNSIGHEYNKLREEAMPWIRENRPQHIEELNRRLSFGK